LPTNIGGGGASLSYYLNGSINQGTIGGVTYYELSKTPIFGAGTDFSTNTNGYIASFLTDAGDPNLLKIPAGNWNFETYFQASSGGGNPTFYVELYKYDGTTFSLIASNSSSPKPINDGTNVEAYFSALAVPETTLTLTDRLAIRIYVVTSGRTITLHTENNTLCQVITTFSTGLTALNGLTTQVQYFSTGVVGTDFNIVSLNDIHTFNLPTASAVNRGALSSADWSTFNNKQGALTLTTVGTSGAATLIGNILNIPQYADQFVGTVTSVGLTSSTSGVTIGSSPITTSGNITLAIATASGSQQGLLSATDWTTFNNKQNALTNPITGTGANGQVAFWNGTNTQTGDNGLFWDNVNKRLGVGTNAPTQALEVTGVGRFTTDVQVGGDVFLFNAGSRINSPFNGVIALYNSTKSDFQRLLFGGGTNAFPSIKRSGANIHIQRADDLALTGLAALNLLLNTTADAGFRLDVNGTARLNGLTTIQGTTASDTAPLGAELLTTGTGDASWTGTSFATGYTHVVGSVTTLTSTVAAVINTYYQITYTVTGRTAGSFTIAFGGVTISGLTATGATGPRATTTGVLSITPTSDFNGTIVLSIRTISASSATIAFRNSAETVVNELRASSSTTNTFLGLVAGARNTTGVGNTFLGSASGQFNTTGVENTSIGRSSLFSNITGVENTAIGSGAGFNNTTGNSNVFIGNSAGFNNTTGNSNVFIGVTSALSISSGNNITTLGRNAGRYAGSGTTAMTSVNNSMYLGFQTRGLNATGSTNEIVIGFDVVGLGSNTTVLGNSSTLSTAIYGDLLLGQTTDNGTDRLQITGTARVSSSITAGSFIRSGGTAAQFLKADGSVDTNTYALDSDVVKLTGNQTIAGIKTFTSNLIGTNSITSNSQLNVITTTNTEPTLFLSRNNAANGFGVIRIFNGGTLAFDNGATGATQTTQFFITATGESTFTNLAGTGTRMVVVNSSGI